MFTYPMTLYTFCTYKLWCSAIYCDFFLGNICVQAPTSQDHIKTKKSRMFMYYLWFYFITL